jgi:hypothetical protein
MVSQYTLLTSVDVRQSSVPPILACAENALIRATQIAIWLYRNLQNVVLGVETGDAGESIEPEESH